MLKLMIVVLLVTPVLSDYHGTKAESFTLTVVMRVEKREIPCAAHENLLAGEVFASAAFDKRHLADVTFSNRGPRKI